jgi:hypothetical protein
MNSCAPGPAICISCSAISSGSSESPAMSSAVKVVVKPLSRRDSALSSLTSTSSRIATVSVAIAVLLPRLIVNGTV